MYELVKLKMKAYRISKRELAGMLGISYKSMLKKFSGKSKFTLDESVKIKNILGAPERIEELFG